MMEDPQELARIVFVLFVAFAGLAVILLFIITKRLVMRFARQFRRRLHASIGSGAPKSLVREIERRLDAVAQLRIEPWLLSPQMKELFQDENMVPLITPTHVYRMKVVDDVKELCNVIKREKLLKSRLQTEDILQYFVRLHKDNLLCNIDVRVLFQFLLLYEHACYMDEEFTFTHYSQFADLFQIVKNDILSSNSSTTASPNIVCEAETGV